jgi:hypothetical protein
VVEQMLGHGLEHRRTLVEGHRAQLWPADVAGVLGHRLEVESATRRLGELLAGHRMDEVGGLAGAFDPFAEGVVLKFLHGFLCVEMRAALYLSKDNSASGDDS